MRDLTLLETIYLSVLLFLSLLPPLLMSFRAPKSAAARRSGMKIVWSGQMIGAVAALVVIVSGPTASYAVVSGLVGYITCILLLLRELPGGHPV